MGGYQARGLSGGAICALIAVIIALCIDMAMRHFNGRKRGCRAIGQQALPHDADTYVASGICSAGVLPQPNVLAALRRRFMKSDFDRQPARNIRGFWCYRTREQTLIFVRLRASRLYCLHLRRSDNSEGVRWVVDCVEGEEYGKISSSALQLARGK